MNPKFARPLDRPFFRYVWAICVVAAAYWLRSTLAKLIGQPLPLYITFYPAVMIVALLAGFWPGILSVLLSAIVVDYWIITPTGHLSILNPAEGITLAVFATFGIVLCSVADRFRRNQSALADASARLKVQEANARLVESENRFKLMANSITQLCWMAHADGTIFWYNDRWYEYTGTTFEEMQGAGCHSVYDPDYLPHMNALKDASMVSGETIELVSPIRGADGQFRLFLARVVSSRDEAGNITHWFGTHTDIHDQMQAEGQLRTANQRLEMAIEAAGLGEWELDFKSKTATRSNRHSQIFGYETAPAGWNSEMFVHHVVPEDRARVAEIVAESLTTGSLEFEARICRADGEVRWIWVRGRQVNDENGDPARMFGVTMDITDRKQVETTLRENKLRLRFALDVANIGEWEVDVTTLTGFHSQRHAEIFGYPSPLPVWSTAIFLTHVLPEAKPGIEALLNSPEALSNLEFEAPIRRVDGEVRWIWCRRRPLLDEEGRPTRILGVVQDITDRKKIETALRANKERLDLALEVAAVGEWEVDVKSRRGSHSQRHAEIYGYPSPLPNWTMDLFLSHVVPESRPQIEALLKSEAAVGNLEFEVQIRRVDGELRWIWVRRRSELDDAQQPVRILGVVQDITERKNIETTLRANKDRLDLVLEVATIGEWEIDLKTGVGNHSQRHAEIFGYPSPLPNWNLELFLSHVAPESRTQIEENIKAGLPLGRWDFEAKILRVDGGDRWIWVRGRSLLDEAQQPTRIFGTALDITDRKNAENALKSSEAQLRLFVEHAPAALAMFDRDMRYIRASRRWMLDSGLGDRDVRGLCQYDLFPTIPENRREAIRRGLAGEVSKSDGDLLELANGRQIWFRWEIRPWLDASGAVGGIMFFGEDITESKRIETNLRESKERLDLALMVANLGEWDLDLATGRSTTSVRHDQIFGYATHVADWNRELFLSHVLPEFRPMITERLNDVHVGDEWDIEFQIRGADGKIRWIWDRGIFSFDKSGTATRITGTVMDLTDRKNAETELRANRDRLDLAVRVANLGEWDLDLITGVCTSSQRYAQIFGYQTPVADSERQPFHTHVLPEFRPIIDKRLAEARPGDEWDIEFQIRGADDKIRWVWDRGIIAFNESGKPIRITGTVMDITDRKNAETELRASKDRLALAIKVANLGEFDLDLKTGISTSSQRHAEIFGYTSPPPDWNTDMFLSHVLPEFRPILEQRFQDLVSGREYDVEIKIRRVDGEVRWIWDRAICILDGDGRPARLTGTVMDITDRKRAEDVLKDAELRLRLFVEQAPVALAMFDREMRYVVASHRWVVENGFEGRDLTGLSHYDCYPEMPENWKESHNRALAGEVVKEDEDHVHRHTGVSQWMRWEVQPWRDAAGEIGGVLIFAEDITERKLTNQKLRHVTRIYSMLSEINQAVVRERDSKAMLQAACDIAVNRGLFRMAWIGMVDPATREVVPVNHSGNFNGYLDDVRLSVDAPPESRGPATRCIRSGKHTVCNDLENDPNYRPWRHAALKRGYLSSAAFPISVHGNAIGVFNLYSSELEFFSDQELAVLDEMALDISYALEVHQRETERKKIQDELLWRTAFFEAQLESSPDGILVTDNLGNVIYSNRRFIELWTLPEEVLADGMRGERLEQAISKLKNPQAYLDATNKIYAIPDKTFQDEIEFLDGTIATRYASPVHDKDGKYYGRIWVFQDITKRRQMEQQLRQSQKMEAVGQLTGGIAHDFNNLLGVILGNLDLLEILVQGNAAALKRVQIAQKAGERGADVTRRLLAFSRSGELKPTQTDLNSSLRDVVDLARTLGPDLNFATHVDDTIPPIFVDAAGLENALLNLMVNARDAMPSGGTITLSTELRVLDKTYSLVEIGELAPARYACISVTDAGSGMSKQTLDRVFEPFFTTKSEGKGTGLGLAMVYGFVKQSGGAVNIYSELGVGTTVSIYLPLADPSNLQSTISTASPTPMPRLTKVLVVDDEPDLIEITRIYLEQMGYKVFEANAADTALEVAREHPDIDLMITDIIMPGGVNGVELAYRIRKILPNLKIIYSSGFPANAMADRGLPHLDGPMLRKPYHLAEFEAAIRLAME